MSSFSDKTTISFASKSLKFNNVQDIQPVINEIEQSSSLEVINLSGNTISLICAERLAQSLEKISTLKTLLFHDMFTGRGMDEIPPAIEAICTAIVKSGSKIEKIDFSHNALGKNGIIALSTLLLSDSCQNLKILILNNNGIGSIGALDLSETLCKFVDQFEERKCPVSLTEFCCGRNRLENQGAKLLSMPLERMKSLKVLEMPQNGICRSGVNYIGQILTGNPHLEIFNFNDNIVTEEGATCIGAALKNLKSLRVLNLGDCLLRNIGIVPILNSILNCQEIEELDLSFNEISVKTGLQVLSIVSTLTNIKRLNIDGNQFGEEGIEKLTSEMKTLNLSYDILDCMDNDEGEESEADEIQDDNGDLADEINALSIE